MASLVLLLSELLLKHENTDYLTSSPANSWVVVAAKGVQSFPNKRVFNNSSSSLNGDFKLTEEFEELPRICVDFVWP
ncbi:hypothetical protein RND71_033503 [Anisodus tanguticus]|uniref:Uncharacterized protein n=1 Tax=Anisodus tanguticus TaxID=243964 RepID=A0AAE1R9G2_9SOLA|nr:hypothetical protein RND71_033503 [Anisodus tanguticus]